MTSNTIVGAWTIKTLLAAMPGTRAELAARTGRDHSVVSKWIKRLHEDKKVHILHFISGKHGGAPQPVYARRGGKDARPPAPLSNAARCQRQRDKAKAPITTFQTRWAPGHPWNNVRYTATSGSQHSSA